MQFKQNSMSPAHVNMKGDGTSNVSAREGDLTKTNPMVEQTGLSPNTLELQVMDQSTAPSAQSGPASDWH